MAKILRSKAPGAATPLSGAASPGGADATRPEARRDAGRAQRELHPREALADLPEAAGRDPMGWLAASNAHRVPELVAVRHARMLASPFTFYRGAAALMAHDLARLPTSGVHTQLCGDAHLSNFGFFASPERTLLFDLNDFDETHPGPFDWDLRRLAASFVIAARDIGLKPGQARDAVWMLADAYRDRMRRFARMDTLDLWYYRLTAETLLELGKEDAAELAVIRKARRSTSRVFAEASIERPPEGSRAHWNIRDQPPFVYHDARATRRELGRFNSELQRFVHQYHDSLAPERRRLLERYRLHDVAVLTPGVGSVGRRCFLMLWVADGEHPLFLQCKEAAPSVLAPHLGQVREEHDGQRIVLGQRLMQAASDIFLGWAGWEGPGSVGEFYVRQLRDMKASFKLEEFSAIDLIEYAEACGYGLARAHARAGDAAAIAGWIGRSESFNRALVQFAVGYADINEADWRALQEAVARGELPAGEPA